MMSKSCWPFGQVVLIMRGGPINIDSVRGLGKRLLSLTRETCS